MKKIKKINWLLSKHKSISISRFIDLSLYERGRGYYKKKKVGEDFVTSPQISQMFGECISIFLLIVHKHTFKNYNLLELGPGNGLLLKDIVRSLYQITKEKINYFFLEKSDFLEENHFKNLKKKAKIVKLKKFTLEKKPYYFICNEFFDALPVNQFEMEKDKFFERRVMFKENRFEVVKKRLNFLSSEICEIENGDVLEVSPLSNLYLNKIFKHIKNFGGGIIIFDYGPFHKKRIDTLQAIRKKKKCNFLEHPYESDITYHIDFQDIKKKSLMYGLRAYGPISQKKFLFYNGISERFASLNKKSNSNLEKKALESHFKKLTDPNGMGNLIKCIYVSKDKLDLNYFNE